MAYSSKYFDESELSCHCCRKFPEGGIDDTLLAILDSMRERIGGPLYISCAYRCPKHNAEVGGASSSRHVVGDAADIQVPDYWIEEVGEEEGLKRLEWYVYNNGVLDPKYMGIGVYGPDEGLFIHIDTRGYAARW